MPASGLSGLLRHGTVLSCGQHKVLGLKRLEVCGSLCMSLLGEVLGRANAFSGIGTFTLAGWQERIR